MIIRRKQVIRFINRGRRKAKPPHRKGGGGRLFVDNGTPPPLALTYSTVSGIAMVTASNEERLARIEARLDWFATKEDLAQLETRLVKWMVGLMLGAAMVATALATLIERIT